MIHEIEVNWLSSWNDDKNIWHRLPISTLLEGEHLQDTARFRRKHPMHNHTVVSFQLYIKE